MDQPAHEGPFSRVFVRRAAGQAIGEVVRACIDRSQR